MDEDRSRSPYPSDDQAASSVYVLSSGDDTDQHPFNDEDDEDEYGDSDGKLVDEKTWQNDGIVYFCMCCIDSFEFCF